MRFRALVLDHDDTAVDSTRHIHFPAYLDVMSRLRPRTKLLDLDGFFQRNFHPGYLEYLRDELGMSDDEVDEEYRIWRTYTATGVPEFYPGMLEFLQEFIGRRGYLVVVSHSAADTIERDYRHADHDGVSPHLIYGWNQEPHKRKPAPFPVEDACRRLHVSKEEVLVVDDLKPGVVMARRAEVAVGGAGWGHNVPEIREYMQNACDYYFDRVEELSQLVLSE
jgi:beta-phosphoglucomutase-like phosphatase (HAD superfamily)